MMEFYKRRDFSALIGDTFGFFKKFGKNYFKNYFLINGLLLILLVVLAILGYREFFMQIFASNIGGESYYFEEFFENNMGLLILLVVGFFVLALSIAVVAYSFPVFYMKRVSDGQTEIKSDDILKDLKANSGRIFKLFAGLIFIVTPAILVVVAISYVLILIIIGLFLLLLVLPISANVVNFLMYDYLIGKRGFFESLSYSVRAQFSYGHQNEKSPFWKYWGTTAVIYLIVQTITSIFSMVPMFILFGMMATVPASGGNVDENPFEGTIGMVFFVFYGFSLLVSFVLINLQMVASGFMYYDNRTDLHQQVELLEIDTIGTNEE